MSSKYMVQEIYNKEISGVTKSPERWKELLRLAGRLYRYEFDNILLINAQKPNSTLVADYDTWKKVGRYVKRGSKGTAVFPSRALIPSVRYVFDISDTGGKNVKLTWDLEGNNLTDYADLMVSEGKMEAYDGTDEKSVKNALKMFTGTNVWDIINEEYDERVTGLVQLAGSVINVFNEKREGLRAEFDIEEILFQSVMYAVSTRCGFDLSLQEQDFGQIVKVTDEELIYRLGTLVCDVSCSVLREFNQNIKVIESERRNGYGKGTYLSRNRGTSVSGHTVSGETGGRTENSGQIRKNGDELSEGERGGKIQDTVSVRKTGGNDESGGRGSEQPAGLPDGEISGKTQAGQSVFDNGDVEAAGTGFPSGGGNGAESGSDEISLINEDEELKRELDEINSFGKTEEAGQYRQASFFDAEFGLSGAESLPAHTIKKKGNTIEYDGEKYTYIEPKTEKDVPHEYIKQVLLGGTGFVGGRDRVCKIFENVMEPSERAKLIKKEYGTGGAGWPLEGYGLHGYDTIHANGMKFEWRDEEGEKQGYVTWKAIEREIGALILTGEYKPEKTHDHEPHDIEENEAENNDDIYHEDEQGIDDFAIPDEPESYEANRTYENNTSSAAYGMTEETGKKHDFRYNVWCYPSN